MDSEETKAIQRTPPTPADLMQLAINKSGDLDISVLERLAALQAQFLDRGDKIAFSDAMASFKDEMPTIIRSRNIGDRYMAVALEDVADPVMKALLRHGITYRYVTETLPNGHVKVTCMLRLKGTAYEEVGATLAAPPDTSGGKDALKAVGSTTSYLQKYTLMASCGVHVYGTDPEAVPETGMTQAEGSEWVRQINEASTPAEVMAVWTSAVNAAKKVNPIDYKAMTIFTEARDERGKVLRKGAK